jgi:DNA-binding response OmpR family regulator
MTTRKILIVDDDVDVRRGISMRLRAAGYGTVFAADGFSATATAVKEQPDLILLDLGLPAGNGYVVMSRLRNNAALSGVPIVVVTGRATHLEETKAMEAGATAFLQKPVDVMVLLETVRAAIEGHGDADQR